MFWGIVIAIAFTGVILFLLHAANPPPPGDALALGLAADLGGTQPELVGDGHHTEWRVTFTASGSYEIYVGEHTVRVRRLLIRPVGHAATILTAKLWGRSQEDYFGNRTLVPADEGGFEIGGEPAASLRGWEERVDRALIDDMLRLQLTWLRIEPRSLETFCAGDPDADRVIEIATFLRHVEAVLLLDS